MTGAERVRRNGVYRERAERAAHLAGERPHASAILALYGQVLALQESLFESALAPGAPLAGALRGLGLGSPGAGPASAGTCRRLPLERLPYTELDGLFVAFVADLAATTTGPLAEAGAAILGAPAGVRAEILRRTGCQGDLEPIGACLGLIDSGAGHPGLVFFSRSFLQPIAEALVRSVRSVESVESVESVGSAPAPATAGEPIADPDEACPRCGWPPQAAVLRDDGDAQGRRTLVCALCAAEWLFPRVRCPSCGETDAGRLVLHEAESVPGLRVAECQACQAYVKEVDLRRDGHAIPLVEDLATPELDVWAEERGLWKICRNLVGL